MINMIKKLTFVFCIILSCKEDSSKCKFYEKTSLSNLLIEISYSKWNLMTKKGQAVSELEWVEFKDYILIDENDKRGNVHPRAELIRFLKDSFESDMNLNGLVLKERFYSGVKLKYQVTIGLVTNTEVIVYRYDFLPKGFSRVSESVLRGNDYRNWISGLNTEKSFRKDSENIIYCLSVFTPNCQYSELVSNPNYVY